MLKTEPFLFSFPNRTFGFQTFTVLLSFQAHPSSSTTATTTTTITSDDSPSCTNEIGGPSPIPSPKSPPNHFDTMMEATGGPIGHSTLQVPKSPRTPRSMGHVIRHRFTKTFKPARCDLCAEYMFNGNFPFFDGCKQSLKRLYTIYLSIYLINYVQ